jgi:hypothetical protein
MLQNAKDEVKSDKRNVIVMTRGRQSVSTSQVKIVMRRENTASHRVSQFKTEQSATAADNINCTDNTCYKPHHCGAETFKA